MFRITIAIGVALLAVAGCATDHPQEDSVNQEVQCIPRPPPPGGWGICCWEEWKCDVTNTDGYNTREQCQAQCPGGFCHSEAGGGPCRGPRPL